jgi:hypothetical protein
MLWSVGRRKDRNGAIARPELKANNNRMLYAVNAKQ